MSRCIHCGMVVDKVTSNDIEACHRTGKKNNRINSTKTIIRFVNVKVTSNDIKACHRIGKKDNRINSTKTIIRFVNRKHAKKALFNKKKLSQNQKNYSFNTNNNPFFY